MSAESSTGLSGTDVDGGVAVVTDVDGAVAAVADASIASVAPVLKAGVDPAIFLPTLVVGYHPTAAELATTGKACLVDGDCDVPDGVVVFRCSTPYYGQSQCQGAFPPGDQVEPGVTPSCVYYDCPIDTECESEAESSSVTCLVSPSHRDLDAGIHGGH